MKKCPICGKPVLKGAVRCSCGLAFVENEDLHDTLPHVPAFDGEIREAPLPDDESLGGETLRSAPEAGVVLRRPGHAGDTLREGPPPAEAEAPRPAPAADPTEMQSTSSSLRAIDEEPAEDEEGAGHVSLLDTLIDVEGQVGRGRQSSAPKAVPSGLSPSDTVIDIRDRPPGAEEDAAQGEGAPDPDSLRPITFTDFEGSEDMSVTGKQPLDPHAFRAGGEGDLPSLEPPPMDEVGESFEAVPLAERLKAARSRGLGVLAWLLVLLACAGWAGLAALYVLPYLGIADFGPLLAPLPFYTEVLAVVPVALSLLAFLLCGSIRWRAESVVRKTSLAAHVARALILLLLWLVPLLGLLLGLVLGLARLLKRRAPMTAPSNMLPTRLCRRYDLGRVARRVGLLLIWGSLCWHAALAIYAYPWLRAHPLLAPYLP